MGHPPLIVFTDLDGTLLDHETYSYTAAQPALRRLAEVGAPLILASSKTAAEIAVFQQRIGCEAFPAIVENGAGLLVDVTDGQPPYQRLIAALAHIPARLRARFEGFHDLGPDGIARVTGLSPEGAFLAGQRQFSEPGLWHGTEAEQEAFLAALNAHGVQARRGGRFLTLSFGGTKADRMADIASRYGSPPSVALGDAPNDVEMLTTADRGVIVENPHGATLPQLEGEAEGRIVRTDRPGPLGWNTAMLDILDSMHL
ncbi:mannosyl-3-phosphoglycerate phosphatase [Aliiruegeria haliotis]|uniref:Mannosyl-3-phosphoglycerate phosphatase n=1 Tax=Aliiruegeria haliotis TaxID=1280846 RepID=A0A2T0RPR1_9RHOB|nr:HAD-IIB family hydrolase [Aliiruegeria haliotis]PRY23117.1 mannosyl-3-phosphoglycerate phosphatase [Aliiruegeria haliotis]